MALARLASVVLLSGLSGCVIWYGTEYYPSAQLEQIMKHEDTSAPAAGRITKSFQPAKNQPVTRAPNGGYPLFYLGIKDGKICFLTSGEASYTDDGRETRADADKFVHDKFNKDLFVIEARAKLDFSGSADKWPDTATSQLDSIDISERGTKHVNNVFSAVSDSEDKGTHVTYDVELCGAAPVIAPEAKFLTVMRMPKNSMAGMGEHPSLFVWIVDPEAVGIDDDAK